MSDGRERESAERSAHMETPAGWPAPLFLSPSWCSPSLSSPAPRETSSVLGWGKGGENNRAFTNFDYVDKSIQFTLFHILIAFFVGLETY